MRQTLLISSKMIEDTIKKIFGDGGSPRTIHMMKRKTKPDHMCEDILYA